MTIDVRVMLRYQWGCFMTPLVFGIHVYGVEAE